VEEVRLDLVFEEVRESLHPEGRQGSDDEGQEEEETPDVPSGRGVLLGHEVPSVASYEDGGYREGVDEKKLDESSKYRFFHG
jgi:hypothetical protein